MRPVSAAFLRTIKGSHTMVARARVCPTFQSGVNPTGTTTIPILGGDVVLDGKADIRSTLDLLTDGNRMWPQRANLLLAPYGNEVFIERGVRFSDEQVEYVPLGYFRIQSPEQEQAPNGPIRLSGRDRMAGIIDARMLAPKQFLAGATLGSIVSTLVLEVYPAATIEWDDNTVNAVITRSLICELDRFEFIDDLVRSRGKVWYWDHRGVLTIKSAPDPATPVFDVHAGKDGVLLEVSRLLTRDGVFNAVVASGEAVDSGAPVRAVVVDGNPSSPTYFFGRFGPVPRYYPSPFLSTNTQAKDAATAILRQNLGLPYSVDFRTVANPALEPFDPVSIRPGVGEPRETHVLERLAIPLVSDAAMTADTREQTVVLVGSL